LVVDLQYRMDHLDGAALGHVLALIHRVADENYGKLVEIATGKEALSDLAAAFDRSPAVQ
jgi:hypothetical protein